MSACTYCGGSGWLTAIPYENALAEMAFICSFCKAAEARKITTSRGARAWKPDDALGFFLLTATDRHPTTEQLRARKNG